MITPAIMNWIHLYRRMKRWKALPEEGGILDQEERTMRRLDAIADLVEEHERRQNAIECERRKIASMTAGLGGGRSISWMRP